MLPVAPERSLAPEVARRRHDNAVHARLVGPHGPHQGVTLASIAGLRQRLRKRRARQLAGHQQRPPQRVASGLVDGHDLGYRQAAGRQQLVRGGLMVGVQRARRQRIGPVIPVLGPGLDEVRAAGRADAPDVIVPMDQADPNVLRAHAGPPQQRTRARNWQFGLSRGAWRITGHPASVRPGVQRRLPVFRGRPGPTPAGTPRAACRAAGTRDA